MYGAPSGGHLFYELTRIFTKSSAATADMAVLPGVLRFPFDLAQDKLTLRRTVQVRFGSNPAAPRDGCPVARPPRLSEQACDGGQAQPSSRFRDCNS